MNKLIMRIRLNRILTVPVMILIFIGIISAVVWRLSIKYVEVADFCTHSISYALRFILTKSTYLLPFSLAEFILMISAPLLLFLTVRFVLTIVYAKRRGIDRTAKIFRVFFRIMAFCGVLMFIFTFAFGVCYGKTPVNGRIGFDRRLLDAGDLALALEILIDELNAVSENVQLVDWETGSTIMPYSFNQMNKKLNEAYKNMLGRHDLFRRIQSKVKPVILSAEMAKAHIGGIYMPFTGEANVSIDGPDYNLPFVSAHEMSHLMGVAREDEANFVAFLACLYSDDDYIRYSGLVNMTDYIQNALRRADSEKYLEVMAALPAMVINEWIAYSDYFDRYRDTKISKVASTVNNSYLQVQGQEQGVKSYGFVVDLATVYLIDVYER